MTTETIYIPLLNEGTDVWAPTVGERLSEGCYRVLGPMPQDQQWRFAPGAVVRVETRSFASGERGLAAVATRDPV